MGTLSVDLSTHSSRIPLSCFQGASREQFCYSMTSRVTGHDEDLHASSS